MKQIFYDSQNIHLNYLGAYAQMQLAHGYLCLINTLTDRQVVLKGEKSELRRLHQMLLDGTTDEVLTGLLEEMNLQGQYEVLLQEGLIE